MSQNVDVEIYRQRYETFRHMDKLRWQMLQIVIAVGSFSVLVLNGTDSRFGALVVFGIGLIFFVLWYVIKRFNNSIYMNGLVLQEVGARIGDVSIPAAANNWKSSSRWIERSILLLSIGCFAVAIALYLGI